MLSIVCAYKNAWCGFSKPRQEPGKPLPSMVSSGWPSDHWPMAVDITWTTWHWTDGKQCASMWWTTVNNLHFRAIFRMNPWANPWGSGHVESPDPLPHPLRWRSTRRQPPNVIEDDRSTEADPVSASATPCTKASSMGMLTKCQHAWHWQKYLMLTKHSKTLWAVYRGCAVKSWKKKV